MRLAVLLAIVLPTICSAAGRQWQTGTWTDISVRRQVVDFGPGAAPFGAGAPAPSMRAMADVRAYVIETETERLELSDVVAIGRRSIDATLGQPATFAIEKKTIYIRDADGTEHKLRLTKKTSKTKS
jgi:hypothetical protein